MISKDESIYEQKYEETKDENTSNNRIIDIKSNTLKMTTKQIMSMIMKELRLDHQEDDSIRHMHNKFRKLILVQN